MGRPRKHNLDLPRRVYLRRGTYYFVDVSGRWNNLGRNFADAMARYGALVQAPEGALSTMGALFDRYVAEVLPTKAPGTQRTNHQEFKFLRRAFAHMRPEDVDATHVYAYLDARVAKMRANREKSLLSHVFTHAIRWGVVKSNPCRDVRGHKERPRTRYVTDEEFAAVLAIAPPMVAAGMRLALMTGLRPSDLVALRWDAVTADGLVVEQQKTRRRLLIRWTPQLRAEVEALRAPGAPVRAVTLLSTRDGRPYTVAGFKRAWQRLQSRAVERGVLRERFMFSDLRAKSATDHADGAHLGHADRRVLLRHYLRAPLEVTPLEAGVLDRA